MQYWHNIFVTNAVSSVNESSSGVTKALMNKVFSRINNYENPTALRFHGKVKVLRQQIHTPNLESCACNMHVTSSNMHLCMNASNVNATCYSNGKMHVICMLK